MTVARKPLFNLLNLLLACSSINGNEFSANFNLLEFGCELRGINKETFLVKSLEKTLERFSLNRAHSFKSIQEIEKCFCPVVMPLETILNRISQSLHDLDHMLVVEQMESEGIFFDWYINVTTVNTVPNCDISIDLSRNKLGKSTHTCHGLSLGEPKDEMLSNVRLDGIEVFNFSFIDQDPNDSEPHVEVTHNFSSGH